MRAVVLEVFQDKLTKAHHIPGDVIDVDASRVKELTGMHLVKIEEAPKPKRNTKQ